MNAAHYRTTRNGFLLIEVIVSIALLSIVLYGIFVSVGSGSDTERSGAMRTGALLRAEEGLEAVRNMRNSAFTILANGTYGLGTVANHWAFVGTSDTSDGFTRVITVTPVNTFTKSVKAAVSWSTPETSGTVTLETYLSDLTLALLSSSLIVDKSAYALGGTGSRDILGLTLANSGLVPLTIDKMTVSWTGNSTRTMIGIRIGSTTVWSNTGPGTPLAAQSSGGTVDIQDVTIPIGGALITTPVTFIRFSGSMTGSTFTITFTMSDGSTKVVTLP